MNGDWKIADWGTAKAYDPAAFSNKQTLNVGTEGYLPPEAKRGIYGTFTDAFSFGMVVYEMLDGELPSTRPSSAGNEEWYEVTRGRLKPLFKYQELAKDENGADAGIGAKLKQLIVGLTYFDKDERWSAQKALVKLEEIIYIHNKSKERCQVVTSSDVPS